MFLIVITSLLIVQVNCEWVEITQQYKKPMRPTHHHPVLATKAAPSDSIYKYTTPTTILSSEEPATKRNRIYINNTFPEYNFNTKPVQSGNNFKYSSVPSKNSDEVIKKPTGFFTTEKIIVHEDKIKGDVTIIKRTKQDDGGNAMKTEINAGRRPSVPGNVVRVRPTNNKWSNKSKPVEEYKGPIEVLNMADLEYPTAEDTFQLNIDTGIIDDNNKNRLTTTPKSTTDRFKENNQLNSTSNLKNTKPSNSSSKEPTILKGMTTLRRIEILQSMKPSVVSAFPSVIDELDDDDTKILSSSPKSNVKENSVTQTTPYRFPNLGFVKRVHINSTTRMPHKPDNKRYRPAELVNEQISTEADMSQNHIRRMDKPDLILKSNTTQHPFPIKSVLKNRVNGQKVPDPEEVMLEELITEANQFDIKVHKVASIGNIKRVSNPTKSSVGNKYNRDNKGEITQATKPTPEIETDGNVILEDEHAYSNISDDKITDFKSSTERVPILTTAKIKLKANTATKSPEINTELQKHETNSYKSVNLDKSSPAFIMKANNIKKPNIEITNDEVHSNKPKINYEYQPNQVNLQKNNEKKEPKPDKGNENIQDDEETGDPSLHDKKVNVMEDLIKFLKTVTEIISRNTRRGVLGKMRYLEDLRDTIMANIEDRLEAAFPDDLPGAAPHHSEAARRRRSAPQPRGHSHIEFPSSEGALMTISFLTFAVFLIKLIIQVIKVYKNKTMMMMPTVVAAVGKAYNDRTRT